MIDALCHLELCDDPARAAAQAARVGVVALICAGVDPRSDRALPPLPAPPTLLRAWGIHPQAVDDDALTEQLVALERRLDEPAVVAIGECGLDRRAGLPPPAAQERALAAQLALAAARGLPVILHLVRAHARGLALVEASGVRRGAWHAFAGPKEAIGPALALGLWLSVGGLVLNGNARRLREAVTHIPPERLLVETDAPDLAPARLPDVVAELARLRGEHAGALAERTAANARALFQLP
ncbi:MAG: TatD family hydrolase [Deltaproteobacteria bacterium]|nr:TatD family hydrolase [Deltaproteobacteria bacterium]